MHSKYGTHVYDSRDGLLVSRPQTPYQNHTLDNALLWLALLLSQHRLYWYLVGNGTQIDLF